VLNTAHEIKKTPKIPLLIIWRIKYTYVIEMTGKYQSWDIVSQGTINLGTRGPRTFVRGHIVSGRAVTPPGIHRIRETIDPRCVHRNDALLSWLGGRGGEESEKQ